MYYSLIHTTLGNLISCSSDNGIVMVLFEEEAQEYIGKYISIRNNILIQSKNVFLEELESQFKEFFAGKRKSFNVQFDLSLGSDFQKNVWEIVQNIPYGRTRSYGDIAIEMGGKNYTRAVANANAKNDLLLIIPCHRVIGTGNKLTGYRGGIERKKWLLNFEQSFTDENKKLTLF
jgi:AraC family transcriptional regulator, regulatory protein of adaptative response / methylated-DNA-[protein]-cysteine methyltransferase